MTALQTLNFFEACAYGLEFDLVVDDSSFHLRWNSPWPTPSRSIMSAECTRVYSPSNGSSKAKTEGNPKGYGHIVAKKIFFLQDVSSYASLNVDRFSEFLDAIHGALISTIPKDKPSSMQEGCGICVQFKLPVKDVKSFKIATTAALSTLLLDSILEKLESLAPINVFLAPDSLHAQVLYSCWGFPSSRLEAPGRL
jgi:hypothetical protein